MPREPEIEQLREALNLARKGIRDYLAGDYPHPRQHRPSKCAHERHYWEDCIQCDSEHFQKLLDKLEEI